MSAKEGLLGHIHELMAKRFIKKLEDGEELSPQEEAQIIKFLKDNSITADIEQDETTKELAEKAQDINKYPFSVEEDVSLEVH